MVHVAVVSNKLNAVVEMAKVLTYNTPHHVATVEMAKSVLTYNTHIMLQQLRWQKMFNMQHSHHVEMAKLIVF